MSYLLKAFVILVVHRLACFFFMQLETSVLILQNPNQNSSEAFQVLQSAFELISDKVRQLLARLSTNISIIYLPTYQPTYLPTYQPTYTHPPTYQPTYLHTNQPTYIPTYLPTNQRTYQRTNAPTYISTNQPNEPTHLLYLPTYQRISYVRAYKYLYLPTYIQPCIPSYATPTCLPTLSVCLSVCLPAYPVCLSVCLSVCLLNLLYLPANALDCPQLPAFPSHPLSLMLPNFLSFSVCFHHEYRKREWLITLRVIKGNLRYCALMNWLLYSDFY